MELRMMILYVLVLFLVCFLVCYPRWVGMGKRLDADADTVLE